MGVDLALIRIVDTNHKSSCTSVTRQRASVIKVNVAYVNVCISRRLKEELAWVIDKQLWTITNKMLFKTVVPLRN